MTPEAANRIAETLTWLTARYLEPLAVEVVWDGDAVENEESVTAAELVALARSSRLGGRTRYVVGLEEHGSTTP